MPLIAPPPLAATSPFRQVLGDLRAERSAAVRYPPGDMSFSLARTRMLPMFHRERIAAAHVVMREEADRAVSRWRDGLSVDLYPWTRELTLRVAARALFGLDNERDAARKFRRALDFWSVDFHLRLLRGPRTPWARMIAARDELDELVFSEIARRRRAGVRGEDLLSLLLDATDEDGSRLSDQHVRDEVMTLLFAGHDTTTASVCFLLYELARAPAVADRVALELDRADSSELLERALDEGLRLWPPAWIGPRRSLETFELHGVPVPGGAHVAYSSLATHRLPDLWDQPDSFLPQRWESRGPRLAAEGRVHPVRRRLPELPGDALRAARSARDRRPRAQAVPRRAAAGLDPARQADPHPWARGRGARARAATSVTRSRQPGCRIRHTCRRRCS